MCHTKLSFYLQFAPYLLFAIHMPLTHLLFRDTVESRGRRSTPCPAVKIARSVSLAWVTVMRHTHALPDTAPTGSLPLKIEKIPKVDRTCPMEHRYRPVPLCGSTGCHKVVHEDDTCLFSPGYRIFRLNVSALRHSQDPISSTVSYKALFCVK